MKKYTKEELLNLPLNSLKAIDFDSPEYEALVNEVVKTKLVSMPVQFPINRKDIPDIKTVSEETAWQKVVDARELAKKPIVIEDKPIVAAVSQSPVEELVVELAKPTIITVSYTEPKKERPQFCDQCDSKGVQHKKICPKYVSTIKKVIQA